MKWREPSQSTLLGAAKATAEGVTSIQQSIDKLVAVHKEQNALLRTLIGEISPTTEKDLKR